MSRSTRTSTGHPARRRPVALLVATLLVIGVAVAAVGIGRAVGLSLPRLSLGWELSDGSAMRPSTPTRVTISSLGVRANIVEVGRAADGSIAPPVEDPVHTVGWFGLGPTPGEPGVAVLVGHVDSHDQAAVFHNLHEIRPGKVIEIKREDRRIAAFTVDSVERFPKTSFPADRVIMHDAVPRLVLVTCGGQWVGGETGYADNVIVFAHLI